MKQYLNLQKRAEGTASSAQSWTLENIKDGLEYYFDVHGRYPNSREFNSFEYLPSPKTAERKFGGLKKLRELLQLTGPTDFTKGEVRSESATRNTSRAKIYEKDFFEYLTSHIPEVRVHEHKVIRPSGVNSDFFIYTSDKSGVVIDLFYAQDLRTALNVINIKLPKYREVQFPVLFILVGNSQVSQLELDTICNNRKSKIPKHISILTEEYFKTNFDLLIQNPR
jgi:hypothetical protein